MKLNTAEHIAFLDAWHVLNAQRCTIARVLFQHYATEPARAKKLAVLTSELLELSVKYEYAENEWRKS